MEQSISSAVSIVAISFIAGGWGSDIDDDKSAARAGIAQTAGVTSIDLPEVVDRNDAVVMGMTTDVGGHALAGEQIPETVSVSRVLVQAVAFVAQTIIVQIGLGVGGLVSDDEFVRFGRAIQV